MADDLPPVEALQAIADALPDARSFYGVAEYQVALEQAVRETRRILYRCDLSDRIEVQLERSMLVKASGNRYALAPDEPATELLPPHLAAEEHRTVWRSQWRPA